MLTLALTAIDPETYGTYTIRGVPNRLPPRALFLHPDAARAFAGIAEWAVVSDMFRSPESSLHAVATGRGAMPPGYSAHNYGLALDLDLGASQRAARRGLGATSKARLDDFMADAGFYCHRRDHVLGHEAWHYNFLGVDAKIAGALTSDEIEARIVDLYGPQLDPNQAAVQEMLAKLGLYHGEIDGNLGPLSKEGLRAFERAWSINTDHVASIRTRRTLAYVACSRVIS